MKRLGTHAILILSSVLLVVSASIGGATREISPMPPGAMKALGVVDARDSEPAPDVSLSMLGGGVLTMKDLRGKAVLVNFFATWCTGCLWEMPAMERLYRSYKDRGFVVLAVSVDQQGPEGARSLVAEKKLTFPIALDPRQDVARRFKVSGIPTTILIDPEGDIRGVAHGPKAWDGAEARELIAALLPAKNGGMTR